ncbi:Na+/H+ antiporter subunit E [Pseudonocardia nematodicida]|uniref:Na+/H+ antiporter subunit E n=1 Tax=Pseudonocardia nematodicida TaxID=1206997 RepID=A0ABV1KJY2_9PSEU
MRPRNRITAGLSFLGWFSAEFVRANAVVLREVLTPGHSVEPAIVLVSLRSRSRIEIASLMSLLSLTPGTLALNLTTGSRSPELTVHGMHAADPETLRASVRELEDRLLACLRTPADEHQDEEETP